MHGIPSPRRVLEDGDIVSIDVGVKLDGWCSDSAWTYPVGTVSPESLELLRPIYSKTAAYGHFGRTEPEFTWERTDAAARLRELAGAPKAIATA